MSRVDEMSFEELVETLAAFEQENEPSDVDSAIHRGAVERRLMAILSAGSRVDERRAYVRVPGDLSARIYRNDEAVTAKVRDLGEGGVRLTSAWAPAQGSIIDVELILKSKPAMLHPPRAQGQVAWVKAFGDEYELGLAFLAHDDGHRRRMRRVVVELLRRMPPPGLH
jgi:hypothetical protein